MINYNLNSSTIKDLDTELINLVDKLFDYIVDLVSIVKPTYIFMLSSLTKYSQIH